MKLGSTWEEPESHPEARYRRHRCLAGETALPGDPGAGDSAVRGLGADVLPRLKENGPA